MQAGCCCRSTYQSFLIQLSVIKGIKMILDFESGREMLDVCMQKLYLWNHWQTGICLGGAVIIFDTIYYYKQQALDCFRHSDSKKRQKVKKSEEKYRWD